ncbi:hypothetical protein [Dyadobacter sandarakinus]|uniref:Outer membrane protein beta-barrel domain-containing protein n=1 Tax=Dyadobacter sandarakinus TaxID=2747268 RepID=A0ABX7IBM6_9BACT|nr:hypothetical protein [Dyadobacter sandarakinus]QRR03218.1 hypothetical protein HWI92_21030 [Dyadobacter sandarakinus]
MKKLAAAFGILFLLNHTHLQAQGSVGYYPWSSLLSISTNPQKQVWLDARFQTNSLFSSLSIDILPMITFKKTEIVQWYAGGGIRVNPLYRIADANASLITVDGYSVNVGARIAPLPQNRRIQLAIELNPYVKDDFASGVLKSHFGVVYVFGKNKKDTP